VVNVQVVPDRSRDVTARGPPQVNEGMNDSSKVFISRMRKSIVIEGYMG
jgi:hypothetical protein